MARYRVDVLVSPGRKFLGGRRYEARGYPEALTAAYMAAGQIIHRRRVAKYRCTLAVFDISRDDGLPYLLWSGPYMSGLPRKARLQDDGHWLSAGGV